jgi:hypothetical protein
MRGGMSMTLAGNSLEFSSARLRSVYVVSHVCCHVVRFSLLVMCAAMLNGFRLTHKFSSM